MFTIAGLCRKISRAIASLLRRGFCLLIPLLIFLALRTQAGLFTSGKKPSRLIVHPASLELLDAKGEHGLLVTAVMPDGSEIDVTDVARYKSAEPKIVSVSTNGLCRPLADGTVEIAISYQGRSEKIRVTVRDAKTAHKASFRQDVLPILTKTGCNAGACQGKLAGQNGFKLSLRAFAPDWDYDWLTSEVHSRRIDYAFPDESLMILKPTGQVPHEGGQRFSPGSRYHQMLVDWIKARTPGPATNEADCASLELFPGNRTMKVGDTQRLLVRARYPNGRTRDVTWLTQFFSNDETVLDVR